MTALAEHQQELSEEYQCLDFKQFSDTIIQVLENVADTFQHQQSLQPLPDLDRHLEAIHDHIEQLYTDRVSYTTASRTLTHISRTVQERTPISASLDQISYEIKSIHSAIARLQQ